MPTTRQRWANVITVILGVWVGQSFARFSFGLLLPAMKSDLAISYGLAGWLGTINLFGYLIGTIFATSASLRVPPHRLIQVGVLLSTIGLSLLASTRSTSGLLIGMALGGIGGASAWIPAPVVAASVFPPEQRGFAMGLCSAGIGMGIVVVTACTTLARHITGNPGLWRPMWLAEAVFGAVITVLTFILLHPVPIAAGSPPQISVLQKVPMWWAPTAAYTCFGLGYVLFATYVVAALEQDAGFTAGQAARVFALMGVGNAVGALWIGRLSDRIGRRDTMIACFALSGVGCVAVLSGAEPLVSVATFGFGFGMSGAVVSIASYIGDHVRPHEFSAAFGVVTACFGVSQMIGPRLGGWMADRFGSFTSVFGVATILWFVGSAIASRLPRDRRSGKNQC
jgi:predicted MFS family arabinose efflux permease